MRKNNLVRATILVTLTFVALNVAAQEQSWMVQLGHSLVSSNQKLGVRQGPGLNVNVYRRMGERYYGGMTFQMLAWGSKGRDIHIADNLMESETITSRMSGTFLGYSQRFDLTPESRVKCHLANSLGFFSARYRLTHDGQALIFLPSSDEIYEKRSAGFFGDLSMVLYLPLSKKTPIGLSYSTGVLLTTGIAYAEKEMVTFDQRNFYFGPSRTAGITTWINTLSVHWEF